MNKLKAVHRITGTIIMIVLIYLSVTGLMMQSIDLSQIIRGIQPIDPDQAGGAPAGGSPDIITAADKSAAALPADLDINAAIQSTVKSGRTAVGNSPLGFVDLRMHDGKLVGQVQTALVTASLDEATGSVQNLVPVPQRQVVTDLDRLRYRIKEYHRMTVYGNWALWINVVVGLALFLMVVTGIWYYLKMWAARKRQGYKGFFWVGGDGRKIDWKRSRHRAIGMAAAIFLLVVAFSGEWLAYESLIFGLRMPNVQARGVGQRQNRPGGPNGQGQNRQGGAGGNGAGFNAAGGPNSFGPGGPGPNGGPANAPPGNDFAANGQGPNVTAGNGFGPGSNGPNGTASNGPGQNNPGQGGPGGPGGGRNNQRLLSDTDLPALVSVTWDAAQKAVNGAPIKGIRIRAQGNNPQGVVITGNGGDTKQLVFNARTGAPVNVNPQNNTGFPWGQEIHTLGKTIHRFSYFGDWARYLDLFAGAALLYLSINGLALYIDFRKKIWNANKKIAAAKCEKVTI